MLLVVHMVYKRIQQYSGVIFIDQLRFSAGTNITSSDSSHEITEIENTHTHLYVYMHSNESVTCKKNPIFNISFNKMNHEIFVWIYDSTEAWSHVHVLNMQSDSESSDRNMLLKNLFKNVSGNLYFSFEIYYFRFKK